jgi:hypothetical protein
MAMVTALVPCEAHANPHPRPAATGIAHAFLTDETGNGRSGRFLTGRSLEEALQASTQCVAEAVPLAEHLGSFQNDWRVAIVRDRRTDPQQLISLQTAFVPRWQALKLTAAKLPNSAIVRSGVLTVLGPADATYRLPVLLQFHEEQFQPANLKSNDRRFRSALTTRPVEWQKLAEPRVILEELAAAVGLAISNPEAIPHDVWDQSTWPAISFSDAATVILNQFDLAFTVDPDSTSIHIVSIAQIPRVSYRHRFTASIRKTAETAVQQQLPDLRPKWSSSAAELTASLREHARLAAVLDQIERPPTAAPSVPAGSLKSRALQIRAGERTLGELVDFFRSQGVPIEVVDAGSDDVAERLARRVDLSDLQGPLPAQVFFERIFGTAFETVDVQDDKVVLGVK